MTAARRRKVDVYDCKCERCGHTWLAFKKPKACAKCKSRSWNMPAGSVPLGRPKASKLTPEDRKEEVMPAQAGTGIEDEAEQAALDVWNRFSWSLASLRSRRNPSPLPKMRSTIRGTKGYVK